MLVRYTLSLEDNLAWYDYYVANLGRSIWSSVPLIGRCMSARRRERFIKGILEPENRFALGERALELSESGVREFSPEFDFSTEWQAIAHVAATEHHLFLAHPSMNAHIIPLRFFETDTLCESFLSLARKKGGSSANS